MNEHRINKLLNKQRVTPFRINKSSRSPYSGAMWMLKRVNLARSLITNAYTQRFVTNLLNQVRLFLIWAY